MLLIVGFPDLRVNVLKQCVGTTTDRLATRWMTRSTHHPDDNQILQ